MKKILFVITKSSWGGAQRYVFDLTTHLPKDQFEVVVALGGTGGKRANEGLLAQKLKESDIQVIFVRSFMRDVSLRKEFIAFRELQNIIKKERPEVVHLNSSKAGGIGALAARLAGVKNIIFTVHGWPFLEDRSPVSKGLIWLASLMTALLCHRVICISDYDFGIARRMPFVGGKAVRIYNGIESLDLGTGEKIRNAFPLGVHITGTIGELNNNKNQIALIEEARKNPDMYVAIVGSGENRTMLEEKIKEYRLDNRVKLFGFLPAQDVLRGFDMFALPSLKEGLPYVLLEAKSAGLPIVTNRIGGIGEILDAKDMSTFTLSHMVQKTITLY